MKKIKYIIILIIIFLLITLILMGKLIVEENKMNVIEDYEVPEVPTKIALKQENNKSIYLKANDIINKFFKYVNESNETAICSILEEEYKKSNNIEEENILKYFKEYVNVKSYFSKEIYVQKIAYIQTYSGQYIYVSGIVRKDNDEENIYVLIKEDLFNNTYVISFLDKEEFNRIKNEGTTENKADFSIEKNMYNKISNVDTSDKAICEVFLGDYIATIKNNLQLSYNLLDEDYRDLKFGSVENYTKYINKINLENILIEKYMYQKFDDYNQYICTDLEGNYYIFKNTGFMNYTVLLDIYTVDIPQFLENYEKAEEDEKVKLNIQKTIAATKEGDYKYVYNKLDETFKKMNFASQYVFEKYIKEKYDLEDSIQLTKYEKINNAHVYTVELTKNNGRNIEAQIVMQLKEGTDFVMSFSKIEE